MKPTRSPGIALLILLLALMPAPLAAISVFDVIRLSQERYSDAEIVRLIEVTDSRFVLSAEDTVRLREAGVTEAVIREMLARPAPQGEAGRPASEDVASVSRPPATSRSAGDAVARSRRSEPLFAGSPYREGSGREGNADRPAHAAVTLAGIEVLIVRDGASFASPLARARAIAQTLNGLAAQASGRFAARASGRESRVSFDRSDGTATDVVAVTAADVAAWRVGGRRQLSAGTLASFWAGLLNDYWSIAVAGKPPRYLVDSRDGRALEELSRAVRLPPAGRPGAAAISAALDSLRRTDREHLRRLPTAVPEELDSSMRRSP